MNQQINLYLHEFRIEKDKFTLNRMALMLGGLTVVLVLVTIFNFYTQLSLNGELSDLEALLIEETRKTRDLDELLARRSGNTTLADRLARAEDELDSRRQIASFLNTTKLGNVVGFSEFFKDISRASVEGLSISSFTFAQGGESVEITGQVVDAGRVPQFVTNLPLGQSPLRYMRFNTSASRVETGGQTLSFRLTSNYE